MDLSSYEKSQPERNASAKGRAAFAELVAARARYGTRRPGVRAAAFRIALMLTALGFGTGATTGAEGSASGDPKVLRVCADPNNLPYSNKAGEGFENRIAAILADDLQAQLFYFWFAQHKAFLRRTLAEKRCDLVVSVPVGLKQVAITRPYFSSTYVAVTRARDEARRFSSFDDAWLPVAHIGLQLVGNEGVMTPPAVALSARGLNQHIHAFPMWAADDVPDPQGRILDAVANGDIDVAFVWGPFAGFFAKAHGAQLRIDPIAGDPQNPELNFVYPMAVGVRKDDLALRDRLQQALDRHAEEIAAVIRDYGTPTPPVTEAATTFSPKSP